jgi:hypothetical protein
MKNKFNSISNSIAIIPTKARLSEIGSLLVVAIGRLQFKKRERNLQNSLDFIREESVTAASTTKWRLGANEDK